MSTSLANREVLEHLMGKHGLTPAKTAGQNFLIAPEVIEATLLGLQGAPKKATELGAGLGVLTAPLLENNFIVRAIERDKNLAFILQKNMPASWRKNLTLIEGDLKEEEWSWDEPYVVVGNIPYNLSGLIFRTLTQLPHVPERVIFLVQKEVAQRVYATAGDTSLLSLAVQLWGRAERLLSVPAACFWPEPKVDSELILLIPHPQEQLLPLQEREHILSLARALFAGRRKQIGGQLARTFHLSADQVSAMLSSLSLSPTARPQELSVNQWVELARLNFQSQ